MTGEEADTSCKASSRSVLIENYFLKMRMLRIFCGVMMLKSTINQTSKLSNKSGRKEKKVGTKCATGFGGRNKSSPWQHCTDTVVLCNTSSNHYQEPSTQLVPSSSCTGRYWWILVVMGAAELEEAAVEAIVVKGAHLSAQLLLT